MSFPADNLAFLSQQCRLAHSRHAASPKVLGPFAAAYGLWRKLYEARAALADQNPTFAAKLLPALAPVAGTVPGLPTVPTGVRWTIDEAGPNIVTVTVDVAGALTLNVAPPAGTIYPATIAAGVNRQTATFTATADGLYRLSVIVNGSFVTAIYVPVQRRRFLEFRELSRYLSFDFELDQNPAAYDDYTEMLAALYAADAAAATGQVQVYNDLDALAAGIEKAPKPTALFPRRGN